MRERLMAKIAEMDAKRGRPLTAREQLENLKAALMRCDSCDYGIELCWKFCPWCGESTMGEIEPVENPSTRE